MLFIQFQNRVSKLPMMAVDKVRLETGPETSTQAVESTTRLHGTIGHLQSVDFCGTLTG